MTFVNMLVLRVYGTRYLLRALVAKDAIEASMKIHGHLGYSTELPLQQRLRDVMAYLVADGTAEIQKRVIARDLVSR